MWPAGRVFEIPGLVTLSIFRRPKRDLHEHLFWQLTL